MTTLLFSLDAVDNGSGLFESYYNINVNESADAYTIGFYSIDMLGNKEETKER